MKRVGVFYGKYEGITKSDLFEMMEEEALDLYEEGHFEHEKLPFAIKALTDKDVQKFADESSGLQLDCETQEDFAWARHELVVKLIKQIIKRTKVKK